MMKRIIRAVPPLSTEEKLRIQFRKHLKKGFIKNAEMDPVVAVGMTAIVEPEETLIVRVVSTKGQYYYWFSDRRLLREYDGGIQELLRYESLIKAHWMFKDKSTRMKLLRSEEGLSQFKANYFDRLEIELQDRLVVLEGLDQAYSPVLHFFWWVTRTSMPPRP
jgi:hypothetical protein